MINNFKRWFQAILKTKQGMDDLKYNGEISKCQIKGIWQSWSDIANSI